jgi:hypothetical protein
VYVGTIVTKIKADGTTAATSQISGCIKMSDIGVMAKKKQIMMPDAS